MNRAPPVPSTSVLDDLAGGVALSDDALTTRRVDPVALPKREGRGRVSVIERFRVVGPVNDKRSDAVNLHDRAVGTIPEHRAAFWRERVIAGVQRSQRGLVPDIPDREIPGSLPRP